MMASGSQNMTSYKVKTIASQYTSNGGKQPPNYFGTNTSGILMMNTTVNGNSQYKDWLIMDAYDGTDVGGGVAIGVNRQSLGAYIMRSAATRTVWAESAELLGTHNYTNYTVTKTGSGASGTWSISISGNADTVDNLHASDFVRAYGTTNDNIDSNWGQSFKTFDPIPSGTPPAQNPNISTINIGDNYSRRKQLAFLYSTNEMYLRRRVDGSWSDWSRFLHNGNYTDYTVTKTGGGASGTWGISISGTATKATQDQNGYNLADTYAKWHVQVVNLSGLNASTYYPVVASIPKGGMRRVGCVTQLDGGNQASWASHGAGHTSDVEILTQSAGWGTTYMWSILLIDQQDWTNSSIRPVGYQQLSNGSLACFWLRGGAKYKMGSDWHTTWTIDTASTTHSGQTVAPTTSYPGISTTIKLLDASAYSYFIRAYGAVWNDYAEFRKGNTTRGGICVYESKNGLKPTEERLQAGCRLTSDTYGFAIGETEEAKTPIAVSGRVLVYTFQDRNKYQPGDALCSAPNGTVDIMTREEIKEYPDRIVGIVSEIPTYTEWQGGAAVPKKKYQQTGVFGYTSNNPQRLCRSAA